MGGRLCDSVKFWSILRPALSTNSPAFAHVFRNMCCSFNLKNCHASQFEKVTGHQFGIEVPTDVYDNMGHSALRNGEVRDWVIAPMKTHSDAGVITMATGCSLVHSRSQT